jgi:hypothetical protein
MTGRGGFTALVFGLALLFHGNVFAQESKNVHTWVMQLNANRSNWANDAPQSTVGNQNTGLFQLSFISSAPTSQYGIMLLGNYVETGFVYNHDNSKDDFSLNRFTDTTISTYYQFTPLPIFQLRLGVDISLPTGKTKFSNSEINSLFIDNIISELVPISTFGKGIGFAPNIVGTVAFGKSMQFGFGARYEFTGEYDPTSEVANDNYNPGDSLMLMGSFLYTFSNASRLVVDGQGVFTTRDRDQSLGDVFKQGDQYKFSGRYVVPYQSLAVTLGLSYSTQGKNQENITGGGVVTEDRNTNNNQWEAYLSGIYSVTKSFAATWTYAYKKTLPNSADSTNPLFDGGWSKQEVGGGIVYDLSKSLYMTVNVSLFRLNNRGDTMQVDTSGNQINADYDGINTDVGFVYSFSR